MYITKETKCHLACHCHDNGYAAGPVLIKTKIPRFYLKQGLPTSKNLMGTVKTIWEPCVFPARTSDPFQRLQMAYLVFRQKRLEPKVLPWQQHGRCHSVSFVMYISGAKFEEHCSNISRDILDSVFYCSTGTIYDVITLLICSIANENLVTLCP